MNNLPEEDETEEEEQPGDKISDVNDKNELKANGAHLSAEVFFDDQKNLNGMAGVGETPPQNLIISRVNGFKTETCI